MDKSLAIKGSVVLLVSLIVGSALIVQFGILPLPTGNVIFEEIEQGFYCGLKARVNYVIEDNETWNTLWTDMYNISSGVPTLPYVNFTSDVVIAVFIGEFPTGGYVAQITAITFSAGRLIVSIREQHPGEGCGLTMALTQPYHIAKANVTAPLQTDFVYNIVIHNCS